MVGMVAIIAIL
jgi:hypothetical protein